MERGSVVVVFPFVPVTPTTASSRRRLAEEGVGRDGHRRARVRRRRAAARRARAAARRRARPRPRATASAAKSWPSARAARDAEEEEAGLDRARVVGEAASPRPGAGRTTSLGPSAVARRSRFIGARVYRARRPCPSLRRSRKAAQVRRLLSALRRSLTGASGSTSRYWRSKRAISLNAGAATTPPQIAPRGESTATRITSRGFVAGTAPTNDAT